MDKTFDTPGRLKVVVANAVGLVSISSAEARTTTHVMLEAQTPDAEELVARATVECVDRHDGHEVRVKIPHRHGMRFMRRNAVAVTITMPIGGDVDIDTASADVELSGQLGDLDVKTASGNVDADGGTGEVSAMTASGDIVLGRADGAVRLKSASGDFRVSQVEGPLTAATASGSIEVGAAADRVEVRCTSGNVRFGHVEGDVRIVAVSGDVRLSSYAAGRLHVRSVSGDLLVGIAPGANLSVDAESMSGTVRSDIPLSDMPSGREGGREVAVTARSVSGDVIIERAVDALAS